jgi:3-methyladenine DNA glycosylase Mpg
MRIRRRSYKGYDRHLDDDDRFIPYLCNGPVTVCDALGITDQLYTLSHQGKLTIGDSRFALFAPDRKHPVEAQPRNGLDKQLKAFKPERAAHPCIEQHQLAPRRFVMKDRDTFPSCLPDPD